MATFVRDTGITLTTPTRLPAPRRIEDALLDAIQRNYRRDHPKK